MAFYKITYNEQYRFATVHNYGCTFHCPTCSYKLRSGSSGKPGLAFPAPKKYLETAEIKEALRRLPIRTCISWAENLQWRRICPNTPLCKEELNVSTSLGHTNGSKIPLPYLDGANVGLKAWDEDLHRTITGQERDRIYANVAAAHKVGMDLKINIVYVPGLVDLDQVEGVAAWLASVDKDIPFHIMGYIPVPGQPYPQPTAEQMMAAETLSRRHLRHVASSRLEPDHALRLADRDDRFAVTRVL